jgi:hypothetical protein
LTKDAIIEKISRDIHFAKKLYLLVAKHVVAAPQKDLVKTSSSGENL